MAEKKKVPAKEIKTKVYLKSTLRDRCKELFGITKSTFDGATFDLPDGEYTIEEVGNIIKTWMNKEVF